MDPTLITNQVTLTNFTQVTASITNVVTVYTPEVAAQTLEKSLGWFIGFVGIFLTIVVLGVATVGLAKYFRNRDLKPIKKDLETKGKSIPVATDSIKNKSNITNKQLAEMWHSQGTSFDTLNEFHSAALCYINSIDAALQHKQPPENHIALNLSNLITLYDRLEMNNSSDPRITKLEAAVKSKKGLEMCARTEQLLEEINNQPLQDIFTTYKELYLSEIEPQPNPPG